MSTTGDAITPKAPTRRRGGYPLPPEHVDIDEAIRNFARGLSRSEQIELAHEVALTQGPVLCRAYRNLRAVTAGFRTRRTGDGGRKELHRTPCIGFIVGRKWETSERDDSRQALPRHVMAFGTVNGRRVPCAIPTDVRAKADYGKPVPHDEAVTLPFGVLVDRNQAPSFSAGVVTCAVTRPADPASTFIMSCRHVFSRTSLEVDPDKSDLPVLLGTAARTPLGLSTRIRGVLQDRSMPSFDAQLARVQNGAALSPSLGGIGFDSSDSYVKTPGDIALGFWVATGRTDDSGQRLLVWVDFVDFVPDFTMPYELIDGSTVLVRHVLVIHGTPQQPLIAGDSGSPAIRVRRGQILVGMYIGGDDANAYVIPAWQLMTPSNLGCPGESGWALA